MNRLIYAVLHFEILVLARIGQRSAKRIEVAYPQMMARKPK